MFDGSSAPGADRKRAVAGVLLAGFVLGLASAPAFAAEPARWYEEIQVNAFLSSSLSRNFNHPASRLNQYRVFDQDDGSFRLDVVEVVVQKNPAVPGETGFRVDFTAGSAIPRVTAASGLFRDAAGNAQDFDFQQGYLSYIASVGSGLRFDLGKFVTPLGYEVIEGYDGFNDNATRSLLFGYAIPFTHTGLKCSYTFEPRAAGSLFLVNGWDNVRDNNRGKSVGAQLALTLSRRTNLVVSYIDGPEQSDDNRHFRQVVDGVLTIKAGESLSLACNADYGSEDSAIRPESMPATRANWQGIALYARATLSPRLALISRAEVFDDLDGYRTGTPQTLRELTLTPEWHATPRLVVRADFRVDRSSRDVFERGATRFRRNQATAALNAVAWF